MTAAVPPDQPGTFPADHGCLPQWRVADLPQPLPFSLKNAIKTIGPGAILLAGSIGGGEWIVGPLMVVQYGRGVLWIATAAIILQMIFNLEAVRYTLYTGEPVVTGFMRLRPGARLWSIFYIVMSVFQLATPALALGCATVIFAAGANRLPDDAGADAGGVMWIALVILVLSALLLMSGKSIEKTLERLSWIMVALIFSFLIVVNLLFVPLSAWTATLAGFLRPRALPENMDILLLAAFAATAGAGGLGNIAISNWFRDKGFGMGAHVGGIGGALAKDHQELETIGCVFPITETNLSRWRDWWRYALVDQAGLWAIGCAVGMFLNVNLAAAIVPAETELTGYAAGAFQAKYMAERLWSGFWILTLLNGCWVLLSTHISNTDCLTRTVADICWAAFPRLQKHSISTIYALLLTFFVIWGVVALAIGEHALDLFKVLAIMASPIMAVASIQLLRVNTRFLPKELQPPLWRKCLLLLCGLTYFGVSIAILLDFVA